jgi:hypothetical protein
MSDREPEAPPGESSPPTPDDDSGAQVVERVPTKDMRAEFAHLSTGRKADSEAERAFLESKIDMIRSDPTLSEAEKAAAIAEITASLSGDPQSPQP